MVEEEGQERLRASRPNASLDTSWVGIRAALLSSIYMANCYITLRLELNARQITLMHNVPCLLIPGRSESLPAHPEVLSALSAMSACSASSTIPTSHRTDDGRWQESGVGVSARLAQA